MSQFYSRYVPPSKAPPKPREAPPTSLEKRRRSDETSSLNEGIKHHKKRKVSEEYANGETTDELNAFTRSENGTGTAEETTGQGILNKYRVSQFAKSQSEDVNMELKKTGRKRKSKRDPEAAEAEGTSPKGGVRSGSEAVNGSTEALNDNKHSGVFSRYEKSRRQSNSTDHRKQEDEDGSKLQRKLAEEVIHDLVPLPQPDNADIESKLPTYSTLPSWQAAATNVLASNTVSFDSLGLSETLLSNLKSQKIEQAFSIQSAVIPLLMDMKRQSKGDLCISAATGSGKTLAYVVPIVEDLRKQRKTELRAVIVVPTRELVKQVKDTCELCAAGSTIRIVTAVGSKSLSEEQKSLVEEGEILDPEAYAKELMTPVDWSTFSLEGTLQKARSKNPKKIVNYVTRRTLKADVLITTPGRLVDHLQNTKGFHLDDVKWLVVDEADRLLNESYQEWIDVVVPALNSRNATVERDKILPYMRVDPPPRIVRKVLLSATMTRDISKLNSIGLNDPRMIVLEATQNLQRRTAPTETGMDSDELITDATGKYTLPDFLHEVAVTFKEGSDKPLLLLELLKTNINLPEFSEYKRVDPDRRTVTSQHAKIDSSDSESTSSSGDSDSDSDSETSSGSSSDDTDEDERRPRKKSDTKPGQPASGLSSSYSGSRVLVFTRSTASASRLSRLLSIISPHLESRIATLTRGTASSASSRKALSSFKSGKSPILIATDRASRGIDVPGLEHVISYDIPGSALTYVHRVGRTARAGQSGTSWTMVEHREGKWFWDEIGGKSGESMIQRSRKIKKMKVAVEDEDAMKRYEEALQILGSEVKGS